ncbi:MAG TPA: beta-ketoacyl-ACP synthase II [Anaerolineales bacterium]|nr:beta-ketoacyl-ACP synthase II [Anaerolineales bacterium]
MAARTNNGGKSPENRVVITGLGTVNPLGNSVEAYWDGLTSGRSGIGRITHFDVSKMPCQIGGELKGFDPLDYMDRKDARRAPRVTQMILAATTQAMADAGLPETMPNPERAGVLLGTGVGGLDRIMEAYEVLQERGYDRLNPFHLPSAIPNMPASQIAIDRKCFGPNNTVTTACAAGTQAVGEGAQWIRRGLADIVIAGGTEAVVMELVLGAFTVMRALPLGFNDRPEEASRPFDSERDGFVLSEGAAVLILEKLEHAIARGARIYAEVTGHASSSDGYHVAAMEPEGAGPSRAMRWALEDAGIEPAQIDYINAHGTSTPLNDLTETKAIKTVFGEAAYDIAISSTKSMVGHAMGASGALEAMACALAIHHELIPPTINYEHPDPECDLNYVPNKAISRKVEYAMSNSFGLGGQNACLVLNRYNGGEEANAG